MARSAKEKGAKLHADVEREARRVSRAYPGDCAEFDRRLAGKRNANWDAKAPSFTKENGAIASRAAFGAVLNATADCLPELVGGSADLTPSNNTSVKAWKNFEPGDYAARYVHFGIREHGDGVDHERHGAASRRHSVRRHVPDLLGLHAAARSGSRRS